ncbi:MAG TPA: DUF2147 domain-containing protein [Candidatus Saccharimonadales bacterium]|nr:DUF2147 domain-containing protein [Candidatus Saccharimonadales bacterium]
MNTNLCHKVVRAAALGLCMLSFFSGAHAQKLSTALENAIGRWQVINDEGKPGGQVETYLVDGKLFGKVTQLRPGRLPDAVCEKCSGELKNKPIQGMVILRNFKAGGEDWVGGTVVDPDNGKEYKGKIWAVGNDKLYMRGFIGISLLGRTQSWKRLP